MDDIPPFFSKEKSIFFVFCLFRNPPTLVEPNCFAPVDPFNNPLFLANSLALPLSGEPAPPLEGIPPFNPSLVEANLMANFAPPNPAFFSVALGAGMKARPGLTTSVPPWSVIDMVVAIFPSGNSGSSLTFISATDSDSDPLSVG